MDEQLLGTTTDFFYFVTRFFKPITVSATHIYHSALELSPVSSAVRKLHYHRRPTPFPKVAAGIPDEWDPVISVSNTDYSFESSFAWSLCGRFVVMQTKKAVEVRDPLTLELLSTLKPTEPTSQLIGPLAYSPDGRSLACASNTAVIVWDIQTGGVAREIQYDEPLDGSLVWSLDGKSITTMVFDSKTNTLTLRRYDVVSNTALSPISLRSEDKPHLWADSESFRVMTAVRDGQACTIDIFKVKATATKTKSFPIQLEEGDCQIKSFSPTTYRLSVSANLRVFIFDPGNSGGFKLVAPALDVHCFSPDGSLFAGSGYEWIHIWKYDDGRYDRWRQFPTLAGTCPNLLFSPTSPSIMANLGETLKLWYSDGPYIDSTVHCQQRPTFSRSGAYLTTATIQKNIAVITNLHSQTPSQFIDTGDKVEDLGLTGNVLLVVMGSEMVAWLLTEEGMVNGVFGNRGAGRGDSIWAVSKPRYILDLKFSIEGETGVVESDGNIVQVYNTRTGEVCEPARTPLRLNEPRYSITDIRWARHLPPGDDWKPSNTLKDGWVKDREGRRLLWLPAEWRAVDWDNVEWFSNIATIRFKTPHFEGIAKLY